MTLAERKAKKAATNKVWYEANKEKRAVASKKWYEANKEKALLYAKKWKEANKERKAATNEAWCEANKERRAVARKKRYEANKEKCAATTKAWREANKEKCAATTKAWKKTNPEKVSAYARKRSYGITGEQFKGLLTAQGGKCPICLLPFSKTPRVDHCHKTGLIRGLLCHKCNSGIGMLGDDFSTVIRAASYIRKYATSPA